MTPIFLLIRPRLQGLANTIKKASRKERRFRIILILSLGIVFWTVLFAIFYRVLSYFKRVEGFGDVLALKLLSMVLVTFFALLIFSGVITLAAKLYLSRDLPLVHSLPVLPGQVFLARFFESFFDSSWMVALYSLPIFLSYGIIYQAGFSFYLACGAALLLLSLAAVALSAVLMVTAAVILPAQRIRSMAFFLGALILVLLVVTLRLIRPEQLVDPQVFLSLAQYLQSMETPGNVFLPTTWAHDLIRGALFTGRDALLNLGLLVSFSGSLLFCAYRLADRLYFLGYSQAQNAPVSLAIGSRRRRQGLERYFSGVTQALVLKEIRTFRRDQTQWPQLLLIFALVLIYVYNFSVLPLGSIPWRATYLKNFVSFLNIGLAGFVLSALAARFVYPAVSMEGAAFWLIRTAPLEIKTFLKVKFLFYCLPFMILGEALIILTNLILEVTPFVMILSTLTIALLVPGIVSLALGLGAAYPDFRAENPAQATTSMGGLIFMVMSAVFIVLVVVLEAGPAYQVFLADIAGRQLSAVNWLGIVVSFGVVIAISLLATALPLKYGARRLTARLGEG